MGHFDVLGPNELFSGLGVVKKTVLGSTHVVKQLLFSKIPKILTFDFDLIFGSFLSFWGPNRLLGGSGWGSETILGYTHVVEQLLSSNNADLC